MPRDHSLASLRLIPARSVSSVPPQRHLSSHPNNNTNNNVIILIPVGTPSTGKVQSQLQSDLPGNDHCHTERTPTKGWMLADVDG